MAHDHPDFASFKKIADTRQGNLIPIFRQLFGDQLTPVLAYRRLVRPDDRMAPSFLLESVVGGDRVGRYSFMAAQPVAQIIARDRNVRYIDSSAADQSRDYHAEDPLLEMDRLTKQWKLVRVPGLPDFTGGWVGYAGYDTVRYLEGEKLPSPPADDRGLPDMHMALYRDIVAFDHVQKTVLVITHVLLDEHATLEDAYKSGQASLDELVRRIETPPVPPEIPELAVGTVELKSAPPKLPVSNMGEGGYQNAVRKAKEYIGTGDIFQVVPSQRFELKTKADPFDIYRSLRVVNPSPYMFYVQIEGGMLVGSSPEILCRVHEGVIVNRPLAGTRRRGATEAEDKALEEELLADPKERAEHIMLVDLGRNDVGRVAVPGSIELPQVMIVERYSHVMHLSSTVTGNMRPGLTCWDALRVTLPVGTVSGAPKVRAMQIIDELEPTRRGPYAGAVGYVDFAGNMDMCIALRTMVALPGDEPGQWKVHLQAGGGIVADSDPDAEHQETVNKAAALAKAVAMAESAFT
jgi:anthranilate synthase component 1